MSKVTYALGSTMRIHAETLNYPKRTRQLLANLAQSESNRDRNGQLKYLSDLIPLFTETEDWSKVISYGLKALGLAKSLQDKKLTLASLNALVQASRATNMYDAAIGYNSESLRVAKSINDKSDILDATLDMAVSLMQRGETDPMFYADFQQAQQMLSEAVKVLASLELSQGDKNRIRADIFMNSGILAKYGGYPDRGIEMIMRALAIYHGEHNELAEANALCNIAYCYDAKNDIPKAIKFGDMELVIQSRLKNVPGEAVVLYDNAARYKKLFDFTSAQKSLQTIAEKYRGLGDMEEASKALDLLAEYKKDETLYKKLKSMEASICRVQTYNDPRQEFQLRSDRAEIAKSLLVYNTAILDYRRQKDIAEQLKLPGTQISSICKNLGEVLYLDGNYTAAIQMYRECLVNFHGTNEEKALCLEFLGLSLEKSNTSGKKEILIKTFDEALILSQSTTDHDLQRRLMKKLYVLYNQSSQREKARVVEGMLQRLNRQHPEDYSASQDSRFSYESDHDTNEEHIDPEPIIKISKRVQRESPIKVFKNPCKPVDEIVLDDDIDDWSPSPAKIKKPSPQSKPKPSKVYDNPVKTIAELFDDDLDNPSPSPVRIKKGSPSQPSKLREKSVKKVANLCDDDLDNWSPPKRKSPSDVSPTRPTRRMRVDSSSPIIVSKPIVLNEPTPRQSTITAFLPPTMISREPPAKPLLVDLTTPKPLLPSSVAVSTPTTLPSSLQLVQASPSIPPGSKTPPTDPPKQLLRLYVEIPAPDSSKDVFVIPCDPGMDGTPKTFKWLKDETTRRYRLLYHSTPRIRKLVLKEDDSDHLLFDQDSISQVLEDKQRVYAVIKD